MVTRCDADAAFRALADRTRREIVEALAEKPMPVHDLSNRFPISRPAVSRHLKLLMDADLVSVSRVGKENLYRLNDHAVDEVVAWLERFWFGRLKALKAVAERAQ